MDYGTLMMEIYLTVFYTKHVESGERKVADLFTNPNSCVLEFGGGSGAVSTIVQKHLNNKKNHIVIQPRDKGMFGGLTSLEKNRKACNLEFQIIDHILEPGEGKKLLNMVSKPFDTVVCDCEGCLNSEFQKNPILFKHIKQIQVERDDSKGQYDKLLSNLGFKLIYKGKGCNGKCETHVFER